MKKVRLLYGTTIPGEENLSTDLLWRTGFRAPDTFYFCEFDDEAVILINDLEYERAKKEAKKGCSVERLQTFVDRVKDRGEKPSQTAGLTEFLRDHSVSKIVVPASTPTFLYQRLLGGGFDIEVWNPDKSFYPQREVKSPEEIAYIIEVQEKMERVLWEVVEILKEATIAKDGTLIGRDGEMLTAESVRTFMDMEFTRLNCFAVSTIIACGDQAVDPHNDGSGPLQAHLPIVFDIFPRSKQNWYWSDMSRTFFKGEPTEDAKKMYQTVLDAQNLAIGMIRAGVDGHPIQQAVEEFFKAKGYPTGIQGETQTMQGFPHGVGHGLGLEIHEPPRITRVSWILPEGSVVTVEPGLYYLGIGGVRIEDLVVVEKDGARNLTNFPKELEDMIIP